MKELTAEQEQQLVRYIGQYVTDNKREKIKKVLQQRTRHIVVVLEDIYQSQNASAVLRSCDCFGIQEAHIIENRNEYTVNPDVAQGAEKWVDIIKYNQYEVNTKYCLEKLKQQGYQVVATTPGQADYTIHELPVRTPTAVLFGTELEGVTRTAQSMADATVRIPMYGFTPSFNISVSAALVLYQLTAAIREATVDWRLSAKERREITLRWYKKILKKAELLEKRFRSQLGP